MDIYKSSLFKYVKGDMLVNKPIVLTIKTVETTELAAPKTGEMEEKYLLTFEESKKPLILNATNAGTLAKLFGRDTTKWAGQLIELYSEPVKAFGKMHNAARVREAKQTQQARASKKQATESTPAQRQDRLKNNGRLLHPRDEGAIGEDQPTIHPLDLFSIGAPADQPDQGAAEKIPT